MITYQDSLKVEDTVKARCEFIGNVINQHKASALYKNAVIGDSYDRQQNTTIISYQKLLYTMSGKAVPDNYSANYKLCSNFFNRFVLQQVQYLLGNGVSWLDENTANVLGEDFDEKLQLAAHDALVGAVAFGFWNYDHLEAFNVREFAPLYDEEDGALKAGVRFWQIDDSKPLRATYYELDGYTDYIRKEGLWEILQDKRPYIIYLKGTDIDGLEIYDGENYPTFPIVPLWGNAHKQSELIGMREQIDAYDLIKSGFANDLDDASQIYWIIQNAGGMDDIDLAKFLDRIKTVKAATVEEDGATAEAHTIEVPYNAREAILERLRNDLYDDYMALDVKAIAGGAATATQIRAAYEPINAKADRFEYEIIRFIRQILALAGVDDIPTFTRSTIINVTEEVSTILSAASYLTDTYITEKVLMLLGDGDKVDEILAQIDADELNRGGMINDGTGEEGEAAREEDNAGVQESI